MEKSFNDFLATLTPDVFEEIAQNINDCNIKLKIPLNANNANEFCTSITSANTNVTLELLRRYHEWLQS